MQIIIQVPLHPCPTILLRYGLQEVPPDVAERIKEHLDACPECVDTMQTMLAMHSAVLMDARIFGNLLGRDVTPQEILEGCGYN